MLYVARISPVVPDAAVPTPRETNRGDAVVCTSCGVLTVTVLPETEEITPFVEAKVIEPPRATEPDPVVPVKLIVG
jgi:hypothetical protein